MINLNNIAIIIGILIILLGILSIFFPVFTKIINIPRSERPKSIIIGIIIVAASLIYRF